MQSHKLGMTRNPFHLDAFSPHHLLAFTINTPLIFTSFISDCVGIGFLYKEQNHVVKMGIYHSYGEHGECEDALIKNVCGTPYEPSVMVVQNNLIRFIYDFINPIQDSNAISIIIHINGTKSDFQATTKEKSFTFLSVKKLIDQVTSVINKNPIPNFHYSKGGGSFCLMSDGSFWSPTHGFSDENEQIAKRLANYIHHVIHQLPSHRPLLTEVRCCDAREKKVTTFERALLEDIHSAQCGTITWLQACLNLNRKLEIHQQRSPSPCYSFFPEKHSVSNVRYQQFLHLLECLFDPYFPAFENMLKPQT